MYENVWIWNKVQSKYLHEGPIDNMSALVQVMAWRQAGTKTSSQSMMNHHMVSQGHNELMQAKFIYCQTH